MEDFSGKKVHMFTCCAVLKLKKKTVRTVSITTDSVIYEVLFMDQIQQLINVVPNAEWKTFLFHWERKVKSFKAALEEK